MVPMLLQGWVLVPIAAAVVLLMVAGILGVEGVTEAGVRASVRATARSSGLIFLLPFLASTLRRQWVSPPTAWLLRNRRYLGVSFAVSHLVHLGTIVALFAVADPVVQPAGVAGGVLAYAFVAAMVATSTDRTAAWLGSARWRRLHTTGLYYLWFLFTLTYARRAGADPISALYTALFVVALVLRLGLRRPIRSSRRRSGTGS
jgi:hypothetical protein